MKNLALPLVAVLLLLYSSCYHIEYKKLPDAGFREKIAEVELNNGRKISFPDGAEFMLDTVVIQGVTVSGDTTILPLTGSDTFLTPEGTIALDNAGTVVTAVEGVSIDWAFSALRTKRVISTVHYSKNGQPEVTVFKDAAGKVQRFAVGVTGRDKSGEFQRFNATEIKGVGWKTANKVLMTLGGIFLLGLGIAVLVYNLIKRPDEVARGCATGCVDGCLKTVFSVILIGFSVYNLLRAM